MGKITLSPTELKVAEYLTEIRIGRNQKTGAKATPYGRSLWEVSLHGFHGELAFCKMFNLNPDLTSNPRTGGGDCKDHNGHLVDVKTPFDQTCRIKAIKEKPEHEVDYFAFMFGTAPTFVYAGKIRYDDAIRCERRAEGKENEYFYVPFDLLSRGVTGKP